MDKINNQAKILALKDLQGIRESEIRNLWLKIGYSIERFWEKVDITFSEVQSKRFQDLTVSYSKIIKKSSRDIYLITFMDEDFPNSLLACDDYPLTLWLKGDKNLINDTRHKLAIVGTRKCSSDAKDIINKQLNALKSYPVCIISGMAFGIDKLAHKLALQYKLPTIAVIPGGINQIIPQSNQDIYEQILANKGLIISENLEEQKITKYIYPKRNRIVAGLCNSLLLIQAPKKSGALISAQLAFDYGREVFAIPGDINKEVYSGSNKFISLNIARCVNNYHFLINELGFEQVVSSTDEEKSRDVFTDTEDKNLSDIAKQIIKLAFSGVVSLTEICVKIDKNREEIIGLVSELEIRNVLKYNNYKDQIELING